MFMIEEKFPNLAPALVCLLQARSNVTINNTNVDPERKLNYEFYRLTLAYRLKVSIECDLIYQNDETLNLSQLFSKVFQRAKEQNKFEKLWAEIAKCHNLENDENPFFLSGK